MGQDTPERRKFGFDTVFDGEGSVVAQAAARKTFFTVQELEQAKAEAFAEGQRQAISDAQRDEARCLAEIRAAMAHAMGSLTNAAHQHRAATAELALAAARKIADAALECFPEAAAEAALQALLREVESHPRLLVRTPEALQEKMQTAMDKAAEQAGFTGQVSVKADPNLNGAAFVFEWGEGRAAFDPEQAANRVAEALAAALAAEGLHAESLNAPGGE